MRVTLCCMGFENQGVEALSAYLKVHGHSVALAFDPDLRWLGKGLPPGRSLNRYGA